MSSRDDRLHQGIRRGQRLLHEIGAQLRDARLAAGLSQQSVAVHAGVSQTQISRIESGECRTVDMMVFARVAAVLGLELAARLYPTGSPLRDTAHVQLLQRLRARTSPEFRWLIEAPLPLQGDRRAVDAVIRNSEGRVGIEAESRLRDAQRVTRSAQLKQRDGQLERMVLLLGSTKMNRLAVRDADSILREAFPLGTRDVMRALEAGHLPEANGIVML